jgi:AcrR family transcriptional regulator
MVRPDKRESLVRAAAALFHRKGFEHTSIADIAAEAGVPLGNVYYYFKTRNDLLKAVTEGRIAALRKRRSDLEHLPPRARLLAYVEGWEAHTEELTAHGCPVGGLCLEANKQGGPAAEEAASVLSDMLDWVGAQFRGMGYGEQEARDLAARMVGARHGSILLSNTFKDPRHIRMEIERIRQWLAGLPTGKPAAKGKGKS